MGVSRPCPEGRRLWGGWGGGCPALEGRFRGSGWGAVPLTPPPPGGGCHGGLVYDCAYGMDLAALVGCLLNQVDMWPGIPFA